MAEGFKMRKLVDEWKTIFLGKRGKRWKSSKTFSLYFRFLLNGSDACQNPKLNFIRLEIMPHSFKIRKLDEEYKTIFLRNPGWHWNSSKTFSLYLSFLQNDFEARQNPKSNLIRLEIIAQGFKCENWLTNTKQFFWESEASVETLPKPSPYFSVSYKMLLKPVKSLNRIF